MSIKFQTTLASALFLALAFAVMLFMLLPGRAVAQATSFSATLSGGAEVPPVASDGTGSFSATLDGTLAFTLTAAATGITQAHIHMATPFENGPVVAFLTPATPGTLLDPPQDSIDVSGTVTVDDLLDVLAGDWDGFVAALNDGTAYVNVHTEANPPGEVRGQIANAAAVEADSGTGERATVCHRGRSLTVSSSAVADHLDHGDLAGACATGSSSSAAVDALPATGSGGLANRSSGGATWFPLALASGLALVVVLGGVSAWTAIRRRR